MVKKAEIWKDVKDFKGRYQVSNYGRVRSFLISGTNKKLRDKPLAISPIVNKSRGNYLRVDLCDGSGKHKRFSVHTLVLTTFKGDCPLGYEAAHLDGFPHNNKLSNLIWATKSENQNHRKRHGVGYGPAGESNGQAKLKANDVRMIRKLYKTGLSQSEIANRFNVSRSLIGLIVTYQRWGWL